MENDNEIKEKVRVEYYERFKKIKDDFEILKNIQVIKYWGGTESIKFSLLDKYRFDQLEVKIKTITECKLENPNNCLKNKKDKIKDYFIELEKYVKNTNELILHINTKNENEKDYISIINEFVNNTTKYNVDENIEKYILGIKDSLKSILYVSLGRINYLDFKTESNKLNENKINISNFISYYNELDTIKKIVNEIENEREDIKTEINENNQFELDINQFKRIIKTKLKRLKNSKDIAYLILLEKIHKDYTYMIKSEEIINSISIKLAKNKIVIDINVKDVNETILSIIKKLSSKLNEKVLFLGEIEVYFKTKKKNISNVKSIIDFIFDGINLEKFQRILIDVKKKISNKLTELFEKLDISIRASVFNSMLQFFPFNYKIYLNSENIEYFIDLPDLNYVLNDDKDDQFEIFNIIKVKSIKEIIQYSNFLINFKNLNVKEMIYILLSSEIKKSIINRIRNNYIKNLNFESLTKDIKNEIMIKMYGNIQKIEGIDKISLHYDDKKSNKENMMKIIVIEQYIEEINKLEKISKVENLDYIVEILNLYVKRIESFITVRFITEFLSKKVKVISFLPKRTKKFFEEYVYAPFPEITNFDSNFDNLEIEFDNEILNDNVKILKEKLKEYVLGKIEKFQKNKLEAEKKLWGYKESKLNAIQKKGNLTILQEEDESVNDISINKYNNSMIINKNKYYDSSIYEDNNITRLVEQDKYNFDNAPVQVNEIIKDPNIQETLPLPSVESKNTLINYFKYLVKNFTLSNLYKGFRGDELMLSKKRKNIN